MGRGRKIESIDDYQRALRNGYGLGQGEEYKPWYQIQDRSSRAGRSLIHGLKTNRSHHLMSEIETEFFYLIDFCDSVIDIREQFPLIPLDLSQKIATAYDIPHPLHPKSKEPLVLTTSFLITTKNNEEISYHATATTSAEQLDIERIWWSLLDIPFQCYTSSELNDSEARNIAWITSSIRSGLVNFSSIQIETAVSLLRIKKYFIKEICELYVNQLQVPHDDALNLLLTLIAQKHITIDLTHIIDDSNFIEVLSIENEVGRVIHAS
jgi:hypothetical protein